MTQPLSSFFKCIMAFYIISQIKTHDSSEISIPSCDSIIPFSYTDETLLDSFKSNIQSLISQSTQCIDALLSKGYYQTLEYYLDQLSINHIKFRDHLNKGIESIEQRLEIFQNKYRFEQNEYQKVIPVYQWAQSLDNIYIEVKFAHRFDSPGCLDINNLTNEVVGSIVSFNADCVLGDVPIKFELNLNLYDDIDRDASVFSHNSVGRYQMTLRKKKVDYWKRLLKNEEDINSNMKIWMEMKEKYENQLKSYETQNEDEEFNREYKRLTKEAKEKQKQKRKEKKNKNKKVKKKSDL